MGRQRQVAACLHRTSALAGTASRQQLISIKGAAFAGGSRLPRFFVLPELQTNHPTPSTRPADRASTLEFKSCTLQAST
jgi:hypothetical protein